MRYLKQDRQYQIASANFYAGEFQTAAQQFQQIADERDSPWRMWAPYLVARCYIREATLTAPKGTSNGNATPDDAPRFNVEQMTAAEKQLQSILKNPSMAAIHPASQKLLNYVEVRLHPEQRLHDVAQQLGGRVPASDIAQDLTDFEWILQKQARSSNGINSPKFNDWRKSVAERGLLDDLTDWVLTFEQQSSEALAHALERWHATKSTAWLMAALSKTQGTNAKALAAAAAAIPQSSPAYEMAIYQRARLLIEQSKQQDARQLLDANLPRFEKGPLSAFNLLLAQRFAVAADFHQFLQYAPRTPVEYVAYDYLDCPGCPETSYPQDVDAKPLPKLLDADSVTIFNQRLPLSLLTEAATGVGVAVGVAFQYRDRDVDAGCACRRHCRNQEGRRGNRRCASRVARLPGSIRGLYFSACAFFRGNLDDAALPRHDAVPLRRRVAQYQVWRHRRISR